MTANPSFMSGVPELLILSLLKGREEMYGYEIVAAFELHVDLGEGVLEPVAGSDQAVVAADHDDHQHDHDHGEHDADDGSHGSPSGVAFGDAA